MRYDDQDRESSNIEDRRGQGGGDGGMGGGMRFPIPLGGGGMSITTMLIIGAIMLLFGYNPLDLLRESGNFPDVQLPRFDRPTQTANRQSPVEVPGRGGSAPARAGGHGGLLEAGVPEFRQAL